MSDIAGDSPQQVAQYLYSLLIADKGYSEAIKPEQAGESTQPGALNLELTAAFKDANIFDSNSGLVPHPIRSGIPVLGSRLASYTPAFIQENGHLVVIETVDFTKPSRWSRDHAGWSAYMFHDVRGVRSDIEPIAVVRLTDEVNETEDVRNGLSILKNEGSVVNWLNADERSKFLEERRELAFNG